jgi:hypothetical protein
MCEKHQRYKSGRGLNCGLVIAAGWRVKMNRNGLNGTHANGSIKNAQSVREERAAGRSGQRRRVYAAHSHM